MNVVHLRMAYQGADSTAWRDIVLPSIETLKSLSVTIQKAFALHDDPSFEYEVLGCRAPGHRARLGDLVASGVTRFRYLQNGADKRKIEIVILCLAPDHAK